MNSWMHAHDALQAARDLIDRASNSKVKPFVGTDNRIWHKEAVNEVNR